jgi:hypothetical protein
LVEYVVAEDAPNRGDSDQRLTLAASSPMKGQPGCKEQEEVAKQAEQAIVNPLLKIEVMRQLRHSASVSGAVPYQWRAVYEPQRILRRS